MQFYLLKTSKGKETGNLYFRIQVNGKRYQCNTLLTVDVKKWESGKYYESRAKDDQKIINLLKAIDLAFANNDKINSKADIDNVIDVIVNAEANQAKLEQEQYKQLIQAKEEKRKEEKKRREEAEKRLQAEDFIKAIDGIIEQGLISKETLKQYKQTRKHVIGYLNNKIKPTLSFRELNKAFYDSFVLYLDNVQQQKKQTIGKHVKNIKAVINAQPKNIQELAWDFIKLGTKCKKITEDVYKIALTEEELKQIKECRLPSRLDVYRKQFLLMCWTGVRYSDLDKINIKNIYKHDNRQILKFRATKTKKDCYVALLSEAQEILSYFDNGASMPVVISVQKFNEAIKEFLSIVVNVYNDSSLLDVEERIRTNVRNEEKTETFIRWQEISSHTARRTFITNMLQRGISETTIMIATGHKTFDEFRKYDKRSNEDKALKLLML